MATGPSPSDNFVMRPRSLNRRLIHYTLHLPVLTKAAILLAVVMLGSTICSLGMSPDSAFANPNNPLNIYLVKFSWGWTLLAVAPITLTTAALYSGLYLGKVLRHLSRLAVSHVIWYTVTSLIVLLDSHVGTCEIEDITGRSECIRGGHSWLGFDISGHVFLLTYCIYVITEECANIKLEVWYEYPEAITQENAVTDKLNQRRKDTLLLLHKIGSFFVEPLELFCLALVFIWVVMVGSTSLYFHTFVEKLLGYLIAFLCWYGTYSLLYSRKPFLPSRPDEGCLHPQKTL